jgi:hypothetical protein
MLDPIQYEFLFLFTTLADPEPGAGAETSIFRLQPKVPAPCGSGSTTLNNLDFQIMVKITTLSCLLYSGNRLYFVSLVLQSPS